MGVARYLFALHQNVITPRELRWYTHLVENVNNRLGEFAKIMEVFGGIGGNEREIQVAKVVVNRAPTRKPPHHDDVVFLNIVDINLLHGDLVAPDDDGRLVNIEEQNVFFRGDVFNQVLFDRQVDAWVVVRFVFDKNHGFSRSKWGNYTVEGLGSSNLCRSKGETTSHLGAAWVWAPHLLG